MKVGDMVKINDKTDWYGLYGIIDIIQGEAAFIFCVSRPNMLHPVLLGELLSFE